MRRTKEESEETKNTILNTSIKLFSQKGYSRTTLCEIAKESHVTRGAIYWHFKNKLEIFDALYERLHRPFVQMILEDISKDHPEPLIQLQDICIQLFLDLEKDSHKRQAISLFLIKCDYTGELKAYRRKHNERKTQSMNLFMLYFKKAQEKNKISKKENPYLMALSINCYMKGILIEYLSSPESLIAQKDIPTLIKLFFRGIRTSISNL